MTRPNKNQATLASFTAYCLAHPDERFWQALKNWSGYSKIIGTSFKQETYDKVVRDIYDAHDTYNDE